ncbi:hypothetical protein B0H10DRAFT_1940545 [Mycena sp. CBHHK59/15]|nr:hypothetical protein B0H10DRAFT_1940545 [Mycena sp. CBHHK59/15]
MNSPSTPPPAYSLTSLSPPPPPPPQYAASAVTTFPPLSADAPPATFLDIATRAFRAYLKNIVLKVFGTCRRSCSPTQPSCVNIQGNAVTPAFSSTILHVSVSVSFHTQSTSVRTFSKRCAVIDEVTAEAALLNVPQSGIHSYHTQLVNGLQSLYHFTPRSLVPRQGLSVGATGVLDIELN